MGIWLDWCDKGDIEDGDSPVRWNIIKKIRRHILKHIKEDY